MYEKPDYYSTKALKEGYFARSVYKLQEIDIKFKLFKRGQKILDLGCAPGSWSQYVLKKVNREGKVIGVDYKYVKVNQNNFVLLKGDFLKEITKERIAQYKPYNGIISDMAPDTSGDKVTDAYNSSNLVNAILDSSLDYLIDGGFFIAKIFQGGDEKDVMQRVKKRFKKAHWVKPKSSRKKSVEIFIVGIGYMQNINLNSDKDNIRVDGKND